MEGALTLWLLLVFFATFVEGEFSILGITLLMYQEHCPISQVQLILTAALGAFLGDLFFYELGRRYGVEALARWPWVQRQIDRVSRFLSKYPTIAIILLRFQIGMRSIGNYCLGAGEVPRWRYLMLNGASCALWAVVIAPLCIEFWQLMGALWQF